MNQTALAATLNTSGLCHHSKVAQFESDRWHSLTEMGGTVCSVLYKKTDKELGYGHLGLKKIQIIPYQDKDSRKTKDETRRLGGIPITWHDYEHPD